MAVYKEVDTGAGAEPVAETERPVITERPVTTERAEYGMNVAARIISFIGGVVLALLAVRFLLVLLGANSANGFANFIYSASNPLVQPFFGLFGYEPTFGRSRFEVGTLVAIAVYALVMYLLIRLATIGSRREA